MKCRLLYLVGQLRAGGLERQLYYLLQMMDRERYRPAVAVWRFREDDLYVAHVRQMGVPIYFPDPGISSLGKLRWIRALAGQLDPEVIHSYSFYTNFGAWYATLGTDAIAFGSVRSDFSRAISDAGFCLGRLCARWPRTVIFNSFTAAEKARRVRGFFVPQKVVVVRNGVDLDRFAAAPLHDPSRTMIVAVGSLSPVKRWDRLLTAAHRLRAEGFTFVVKIAGDGPLRADLEARARDLGVGDRVEFVGQTENIPALLKEATIVVHTSDSEGCPNVVMEAMTCGRPVVATDAGDTASLVDDGKTGFIVRRGDDDALVRCIATLISNRSMSQEMSKASRAKAEKEFGLGRLLDQTLSAYHAAGWESALANVSRTSAATGSISS